MSTESFVAPYGDGKESDFSIRFNWDGKIRKSYNGASLDLRFPGLAGGYWHTPVVGSEFGGGHYRPTRMPITFPIFLFMNSKQIQGGRKIYFLTEVNLLCGRGVGWILTDG